MMSSLRNRYARVEPRIAILKIAIKRSLLNRVCKKRHALLPPPPRPPPPVALYLCYTQTHVLCKYGQKIVVFFTPSCSSTGRARQSSRQLWSQQAGSQASLAGSTQFVTELAFVAKRRKRSCLHKVSQAISSARKACTLSLSFSYSV
jgi:hypothetical protein